MTRLAHALLTLAIVLVPAGAFAQLRAELVATGFSRPLAVVPDPQGAPGTTTLIVVEQAGMVYVLVDGVRQPAPFLDLTAVVKYENEQGMLGLAFSPVDSNYVFVSYSRARTPDDGMSDTVISRFRRSIDPLVLDPASEKPFIWPGGTPYIPQPTAVHKGGDLHFGPDGYLYVGIGDGGAGSTPAGNAQHPSSLLGKMLRLDVDLTDASPNGYAVPPDNPFLRPNRPIDALAEIWAFGFRNPWRWSFDDLGPGAAGAMVVADVGEFDREEINYEPSGQGGRNYGWYVKEGSIDTPGRPPSPPAYGPLTPPIADYTREIGRSVTGGYVYRGAALPAAYQGRYFVADYFGRFFSVGLAIQGNGEARAIDVLDHTAEFGGRRFVSTFGRGLDGELYFTSFADGGRVYRIVPSPALPPSAPENAMSETDGSTVRISWQIGETGGSPAYYQLEAGSAEGLADLLVTTTTMSNLVVSGVPDGRYFVRVRGVNAFGPSGPSSEVVVDVGCTGPPAGPTGFTATPHGGGGVSLAWDAVPGATSYVIEAGSGPGQADLAVIPVGNALAVAGVVPPGTYYTRIRAITACGVSAPSAELVVPVS